MPYLLLILFGSFLPESFFFFFFLEKFGNIKLIAFV